MFFRYGLKSKYESVIKEAENEAEVIKKNKLLEVKEKFLNKKADLEKEADRCRQEGNEGLDYFMPMCYRMVGPEGKKVRKKLPLLPGYVFVHGSIEELEAYMRTHPYLAFYHPVIKEYGGVIAVPDGQMESFMRVAQEYEEDIRYFRPDEIDWEAGDSVRIVGGKLDGVEGMLQCVKGKSGGRVVVSIPGLVAVSTWEISPDYLEILSFAPVGRRLYHNLDVFFSNARTAISACSPLGTQMFSTSKSGASSNKASKLPKKGAG